MNGAMVQVHDLYRIYRTSGSEVHAVNGVSFEIARGKMTAIVGRSGAGKTTLLNLIAGLDQPTRGHVYIDGQDITQLSENERVSLRRDRLGFVFQNFGLLPLLTAAENISVPLRMRRLSRTDRERRVTETDSSGRDRQSRHRARSAPPWPCTAQSRPPGRVGSRAA